MIEVLEKYDLAPRDNVGELFRHLYYSQSEEMHGDCGVLIDHLYDEDEFLKDGDLRMAIKLINGTIKMFKELQ